MKEFDALKFIESLLTKRRFMSDNENSFIEQALKDQGLGFDYETGKIVELKAEPKFEIGDVVIRNTKGAANDTRKEYEIADINLVQRYYTTRDNTRILFEDEGAYYVIRHWEPMDGDTVREKKTGRLYHIYKTDVNWKFSMVHCADALTAGGEIMTYTLKNEYELVSRRNRFDHKLVWESDEDFGYDNAPMEHGDGTTMKVPGVTIDEMVYKFAKNKSNLIAETYRQGIVDTLEILRKNI